MSDIGESITTVRYGWAACGVSVTRRWGQRLGSEEADSAYRSWLGNSSRSGAVLIGYLFLGAVYGFNSRVH